ncbi:MAG: MurR/RpiR family transcriptional regulator [Oscillospiraceae bacterium]|nr:MurR/RpiR family transcriptional regulator [Oscillospiraceae bacterium]MDD4414273.1 MurR/RpiR family transcriptional regulator [Oscillospiraceae bacterium]
MAINLISKICEKQSSFSKGQRLIANYIIDNYDKAAFMTAYRLGQIVGVSESTVVRFAAELGFDGYPQLQKAMQGLVRSKLTSVQRLEVTRERMDDSQVLNNIISCDIANIRKTLDEIPHDEFSRVVDALVNARRVYIFGAGSCRLLAMFTAHYLKMLMIDVLLINASSESEIFEDMLQINSQDVIIGISFPRYSSKSVKAIRFAHSRQTEIVAITDSKMAPIAEFASYLLLAHSDMATIVDSLVAPLSIINAIIVAISLKKKEEITNKLIELESLWEEYDVYQKFPGL